MVKNTNAKANRFGREVDPWVQAIWPRAQRKGRGIEGCDYTDTGDVAIELKNHSNMDLSTWMRQVVLDAEMEKRPYPCVIHKRRRYATQQAYVTFELESFFKMIAELKGIDLPDDLVPVSDPSDVPDWGDQRES